jgi:hypothetical protein
MGLDHSLVGVPGEPQERSWDSTDALLYAVGVGAGLGDPLRELEFTTENSEGIEQRVLPTFGVLLAQTRDGRGLGDFDPARFGSMYGRFSRPVLPGEPLTVSMWLASDGRSALFQTTRTDGTVVIDRGRVDLRKDSAR